MSIVIPFQNDIKMQVQGLMGTLQQHLFHISFQRLRILKLTPNFV